MLTVELSMIDLMLTVAVIILVLMFITLLLKLNPSSEKKKDSDEDDSVQEPSASHPYLRYEPLPHQTVPDSMDALRSTSPKVRTVDSWQSREMGKDSAKSRGDAPKLVVSADTSGRSEVEEERRELEPSASDEFQRKPAASEPHAKPESKPFTVQSFAENDCPHKFGYLKDLPRNRPIPNECFGCPRIVNCLAGKKQS